MEPERHLAALRHEGAALAAAARRGLTAPVPSCPGWDVAALVAHTALGYRWVTRIVTTHADAEVSRDDLPPARATDPVEAYEESLAELVETLAGETPDTACWNWSRGNQTVAFWCRRMAQETAVHRWDAENAHGAATPTEPELAVDGVDESLTVFLPDYLYEEPRDGLSGTFRVEATDTGDGWLGTLWPDRCEVRRASGDADAVLRGPASALHLTLWGRAVGGVAVSGDPRVTGLLTE
jgi:uncharacterized protein (TIGR03083 family)